MVPGLSSVNIHPHKIDLCNKREKTRLTFPKISLILFPEGDMTCFFSGDFIIGSVSSSRVAGGLRHDNPPLLLPEEEVVVVTSPGDDSLARLDEETLPLVLVSLLVILPVLVVMVSLGSEARGEGLAVKGAAPPDLWRPGGGS